MSFSLQNLKENSSVFTFLPFLFLSIFLYKWLFPTKSNTNLKVPPSPPKLPLIGHLHKLGKLPHRSLRSLSLEYGDMMLLYLGYKPTLVVSSSKYAQEIMKTHDLTFSNRPRLRFVDKILYDGNDVAFNFYCEKWRHMKSISVLQLLSKKKVNSFRSIREEEIGLMIEKIKSYKGLAFNLSDTLMTLSSDIICRVALGRKYIEGDGSGTDFHALFKYFMEVLGAVSVGDYIPMFGWIDKLSGLENRAEFVRKELDDFIEKVVQEHEARLKVDQAYYVEKNYDEGKNAKDFVDVLLEVQNENPEQLSRDNIKAAVLDMFSAGTETLSTTLEWAMTELIRHPTSMEKLREEVRNIMGTNTRINEDDFEKMTYLDAVIKETLRLHPPAPLLLFRETFENVKIDNYDIAARTQVIINAWAIQRDPRNWENSEDCFPERFLNKSSSTIDFKGQNFKFIPFGSGRRSCPGMVYGILNSKLILASLIREFDWKLPDGKDNTTLTDAESAGITVRPLNPIIVIASPNVG